MKIFAAFLFASPLAVINAKTINVDVSYAFHRALEVNRDLISANCTAASEALSSTLEEAAGELQTQLNAIDLESICTGLDSDNAKCELDVTSFLPDGYKDTCEGAGGVYGDAKFSLDCANGGLLFDITSVSCTPAACTDDDREEIVEQTNQALADTYADALSGTGVSCEVTTEIDGDSETTTASAGMKARMNPFSYLAGAVAMFTIFFG